MRKLASKVLASVTSLAMVVAFCPVAPALAADDAPTQVTGVDVRVNDAAGQPATLYKDLTVNADDAYNAGFTDYDDPATVSAADALVAAHKVAFGTDFKASTDPSAADAQYIVNDSEGWKKAYKMFGRDAAYSTFLHNNSISMVSTPFDQSIAADDIISVGFYEDKVDWSDAYIYASTTVNAAAESVSVTVKSVGWGGEAAAAGAIVKLGEATETTDSEGVATFSDVAAGAYKLDVTATSDTYKWLPPTQGVVINLESGYYSAEITSTGTGMVTLNKEDYAGGVYVDKDGNAFLAAKIYNPNKYDYVWKGSLTARPGANETDKMIEGIPVPAQPGYTGELWTDDKGYYGVKGAKYKAQLYLIPLTDDELGVGSVDYQIRRSPWTPLSSADKKLDPLPEKSSNAEKWMGDAAKALEFTLGAKQAALGTYPGYNAEYVDAAAAAAAAVPANPGADDMDAFVDASVAYYALDYSAKASDQRGMEFVNTYLPEVKQIIDAADEAIPDVVPADGTYEFLMSIQGSNGFACNDGPIGGDRYYNAQLTVNNGKMTVQVAQRRNSYTYALPGMTPAQAQAAQATAGNVTDIPGVLSFTEVKTVYIDHPDTGDPCRADNTITFGDAGEYPMYTTTYEIKSLEKPVVLSVMGSRWFNRTVVFHQSNMFTPGAIGFVRQVVSLYNDNTDPKAESAEESTYLPYKVNPDLITTEDAAAIADMQAAYDALSDADKASVDAAMNTNVPEGIEPQSYGDTLKQAQAGLQAIEDAATAEKLMSALTDSSDEATVAAARAAFDKLSPARQASISAAAVAKLTSAEKVIADKKAAEAAAKKAAEEAAAKQAAAEAAKKAVKNVTVNVKTVNAKAINAAIAKAGGDAKYVTTITLGKKVKKIAKGAFKSFKAAKTLVVKTTKLKKSGVKGSLKGSAVKTVKVPKKQLKAYKKIFTKKIAGKKVKVKK